MAVRPWWVVSIGAMILYLLPEHLGANWSMLNATVDWAAALVPSIERWAELSPHPNSTKRFSVFIWAMIPIQFYWLISSRSLDRHMKVQRMVGANHYPIWKQVLAFSLFFLLVLAFILLPYNHALVDSSPCRVCVNTDRFAQLIAGSVFSLTASGLAAYLFALLGMLIKSMHKGGNEDV